MELKISESTIPKITTYYHNSGHYLVFGHSVVKIYGTRQQIPIVYLNDMVIPSFRDDDDALIILPESGEMTWGTFRSRYCIDGFFHIRLVYKEGKVTEDTKEIKEIKEIKETKDVKSDTEKTAEKSDSRPVNKRLLQLEHLSDVKFVFKNTSTTESVESLDTEQTKEIKSHKAFLSLSSPVFLAMFKSDFIDSKNEVLIENYSYDDFYLFLIYMYGSKTNLTINNCIAVYTIAHYYQVKHIETPMADQIKKEVDRNNVIDILISSENITEISQICKTYIINNKLYHLFATEKFRSLSKETILSIMIMIK